MARSAPDDLIVAGKTQYIEVDNDYAPIDQCQVDSDLAKKTAIDPYKKYLLSWSVNHYLEEITFEVEVETKGYVGFGVSPSGSMAGADIFIAGVHDNGTSYHGDYHAASNTRPTLDSHSDWKLLEARESDNSTILRFSRKLKTCDEEDFPITDDTSRLIWSFGESDEIGYHGGESRGAYSVNLLVPEEPFDPTGLTQHLFKVNMTMPKFDTTYWCTIHKGPELSAKHHIVAVSKSNLN